MTRPRLVLSTLALAMAGCATPGLQLPPPLQSAERLAQAAKPTDGAEQSAAARIETMPAPPEPPALQRKSAPVPSKPAPKAGTAAINFEQVPLTTVIQVVYADVLGRTLQIDPAVMQRRDLVTFRTPPEESTVQIDAAMELLLRSYGLSVVDVGGLVRVVPDGAQAGGLPEIRRGQALPETPLAMRPVFQLVPLSALRVNEVMALMKSLVGNRVTLQEEPTRNALVISGNGAAVAAAMETLRVVDQPVMSGRAALRVTPTYWSVNELANTLHQVLTAEGYSLAPPTQAAAAGGIKHPIVLLPVPAINSLLVFAQDDGVASHVQRWINQLDQPGRQTAGRNLFTYTARNLSAEALARTLAQLFEGQAASSAVAAVRPGQAAQAPQGQQPAGFGTVTAGSAAQTSFAGGRIIVDANSNTLVINTTPENYSQLVGLLNQFDRPPKSALIEVTVAEVELTDTLKLGVDWLFEQAGLAGSDLNIPLGSTGARIVDGGLILRRLNSIGDLRVTLNALATSNQANILSSPRIVARNGETATIQVGSEVPIITSQSTGVVGGNNGLLTQVQYKPTGVQLKVKPSIYAGDRIDLEIAQEVGAASTTNTGVNISPTFSTRKVETRLTLEHGSTVMLGGLISSDRSDGDAGVPLLKDIPLVGNLFKTRTDTTRRRELLVLITPYIINDSQDAVQLTESFKALLPTVLPASRSAVPTRSPGPPSQ
ncbi:MAG: type II secretion system secretin GspD [Inhella sp.]